MPGPQTQHKGTVYGLLTYLLTYLLTFTYLLTVTDFLTHTLTPPPCSARCEAGEATTSAMSVADALRVWRDEDEAGKGLATSPELPGACSACPRS